MYNFSDKNNSGEKPYKTSVNYKAGAENPHFGCYNFETREKTEAKILPPLLVLGQAACISGFNKQLNAPVWSTLITPYNRDQIISVFSGKRKIGEGTYSQIKDKYGKFTTVLLCATQKGEIIRLDLAGSAVSAFITHNQEVAPIGLGAVFSIKIGKELKKNGGSQYYPPIFELIHDKEAFTLEEEKAKELFGKVSEYLKTQLGENSEEEAPFDSSPEIENQMPF